MPTRHGPRVVCDAQAWRRGDPSIGDRGITPAADNYDSDTEVADASGGSSETKVSVFDLKHHRSDADEEQESQTRSAVR